MEFRVWSIGAAVGRPKVGARFIVHSSCGGRGEATPLPGFALRRTETTDDRAGHPYQRGRAARGHVGMVTRGHEQSRPYLCQVVAVSGWRLGKAEKQRMRPYLRPAMS